MDVEFREIDPFDFWIWLQFANVPAKGEKDLVEELFGSWFYLGKLGGFNAENLQINDTGVELSYLSYDLDYAERALMAPMHNMGDFEYRGAWGRCWFDLGTSDAIALDVLVNALLQLSRDYLGIERAIFGGELADWPVSDTEDDRFYGDEDGDRFAADDFDADNNR